MRVSIDLELCEGNGLCVVAAPDLFVLDEDEHARLVVDTVEVAMIQSARAAALRCPRQAIVVS